MMSASQKGTILDYTLLCQQYLYWGIIPKALILVVGNLFGQTAVSIRLLAVFQLITCFV